MRSDVDSTARLLIIDDEPVAARGLSRILHGAGYENVAQVTESWDAVRRIQSFEPDLVLLDLNMPAPDGYDVLATLGALATDDYLPVMVMSGDGSVEARQRALALGASDFLARPYPMAEALLRIRNLLSVRRRQQQLQRRARVLEAEMELQKADDLETDLRQRLISDLLDNLDSRLTTVYQPILELASGATVGAEALTRFDAIPYRAPDEWFADADKIGVGTRLELAALSAAVAGAADLPAHAFLSVNLSPAALRSPALPALVTAAADRSVVIELAAHEPMADYYPVNDAMADLRSQGVRFSIDDAGSGFSGLSHLLRVVPEFIKLDIQLVRGIDQDPARRSMVKALVNFAGEIEAQLIGVGIETLTERDTLRDLGVRFGQGYALGRPQRLPFPAEVLDPLIDLPLVGPRPELVG